MSSFSNLRSERKSKESKSFVSGSTIAATSADGQSSKETSEMSTELVKKVAEIQSEPLYAALPSFLDIRTSSTDGRGIWAREALSAGATLMALKPHVHVLSTRNLELYCSACTSPAPVTGLKRCTRCRVIWYCSTACQNNDWTMHKPECAAIQRWAANAPSPDVSIPAEPIRCLGRLLWRKQKLRSSSTWAKEVDGLQSHRKDLQPSTYESHTHLAHAVVKYLGLDAPGQLGAYGITTAADLVDLISRFITNSITLTAPSLTPLGVSVSPLVALINHSCDPNAVVVYPRSTSDPSQQEPQMQVVAIKNIAPDQEIFTAYIDTTMPRGHRQAALTTTYNFTCKCSLCSQPDGMDLREAIWCPKNCGGTCPLPTEENTLSRCGKCKAIVSSTDSVLDALRVGQEALQKATSLQLTETAKALQLTTNIIPILTSSKLTPSSHPLLALTRLHQTLLLATLPSTMTQEALDNLILATSSTVAGLSTILTPGHPIRALAIAELGKLLAVDEPSPAPDANNRKFPPSGPARLKAAHDTLVRARSELKVGFGARNDGGEVGREVREMVVRLEKELQVWKQGVKNVMEDTPGLKKRGSGGSK